jgi:hypothetical protein
LGQALQSSHALNRRWLQRMIILCSRADSIYQSKETYETEQAIV